MKEQKWLRKARATVNRSKSQARSQYGRSHAAVDALETALAVIDEAKRRWCPGDCRAHDDPEQEDCSYCALIAMTEEKA